MAETSSLGLGIAESYLVDIFTDIQNRLKKDLIFREASDLENEIDSFNPVINNSPSDKSITSAQKNIKSWVKRIYDNRRIEIRNRDGIKNRDDFWEYVRGCVDNLKGIDLEKLKQDFNIYSNGGRSDDVQYFIQDIKNIYHSTLGRHQKSQEAREKRKPLTERLQTLKENDSYKSNHQRFFRSAHLDQAQDYAKKDVASFLSRRDQWSPQERELALSLFTHWNFRMLSISPLKKKVNYDTEDYDSVKKTLQVAEHI